MQELKQSSKLIRYRHDSHPHKLFLNIVRGQQDSIFCNNRNCRRRVCTNEVVFTCFRCDFDLCHVCLRLPTDNDSITTLNESDDEINEEIFSFFPTRSVRRARSVSIAPNGASRVPRITVDISSQTSHVNSQVNELLNNPQHIQYITNRLLGGLNNNHDNDEDDDELEDDADNDDHSIPETVVSIPAIPETLRQRRRRRVST